MAERDLEECLRKLKEVMKEMGDDTPSSFELPTFFGFTIDVRLRQFRKVCRGEIPKIEFIDFESDRGQGILALMRKYFSFLFESEGG